MRSALGSGVELRDRLVLGAASAVLVVLAWRSSAEFSAHIALDASLRQPLGGLFGRVLLAEPVNGLSFRPLSVLLARAFAFLGDPTSPWPNALKALLVVPFLGIARSWWQQLELGPSRVPLLFVLGVPAVLFNVWHPGEFDLVGAILLLAVDLSLLRARAGSAPTTAVPPAALVAAVAALLLKDSVAVLLLVLLAVRALEAFRVDRHLDSAPARLLAGMSAALFVFFLAQPEWGRMVGPASAAKGSTGVQSGPVVDLAAVPERLLASTSVVFAQLLGLLGVAGALTLAAARLPARVPGAVVLVGTALLLLGPEPASFEFFGCRVYESLDFVWAYGAMTAVVLLLLCRRGGPRGSLALLVVGAGLAYVLLPALLRLRSDVSTRVFLPVLVPMTALLFSSWRELAGSTDRARRAASWLLGLGLVVQSVGAAFDFEPRYLGLESVELEAKQQLVRRIGAEPTVLLTVNRTWQTTLDELDRLGLPPDHRLRRLAAVFPVPNRSSEPGPEDLWGAQGLSRRADLQVILDHQQERILVLDIGGRSGVSRAHRHGMRGHWTRLWADPWPWPLPPHSFEDDRLREGMEGEAIEAWAGSAAELVELFGVERTYLLPPTRLSGFIEVFLGRRPILEPWTARARLVSLLPPIRPPAPPLAPRPPAPQAPEGDIPAPPQAPAAEDAAAPSAAR